MNTVYIDKITGRFVVVDSKIKFLDGTIHAYVEDKPDPNMVYVKNGVIKVKPPKPNYACQFDIDLESWGKDVEEQWNMIRSERQYRLSQTDWTQMPDVPLATKTAWAAYRQALRDITRQGDPFNIEWPAPPSN